MSKSSRDEGKKTFNTPDAPIFKPTLEQWKDPTKYLWSIKDEGQRYGICVIQPPESWKPPFSVPEDMTFKPIVQHIHYLQERIIGRKQFVDILRAFLEEKGQSLPRDPKAAGMSVDLRKLFEEVNRRGGLVKVTACENWDVIASTMGYPKENENIPFGLQQMYTKYLHDYELWQTDDQKRKVDARMTASSRRQQKVDPELEAAKAMSAINAVQCEHCGFGGHEHVLLLCDGCSKDCQGSLGTDVLPMSSGEHRYNTETYRIASEKRQKAFFQCDPGSLSVNDVEKRYWKILDGNHEAFEAEYGNDLPSDMFASGFPRSEGAEYTEHPWNLNNMHLQQGNLLRHLRERVSGVNVPWLYMGSCFSSFCWHMEDCYLYSINYHHKGSPKVWYGVPGNKTSEFEAVMRSKMPELFDRQPSVLFHMNTMISPGTLIKQGVPVYRAVQRPGNFIITFPAAYHGGFNAGFNCAEAMNFALPDWLSHGQRCVERYRQYKQTSVLALEQVVIDVIRNNLTTLNAPFLLQHVERCLILCIGSCVLDTARSIVCLTPVPKPGYSPARVCLLVAIPHAWLPLHPEASERLACRIYQEQRQEMNKVCDSGTAQSEHVPESSTERQCAICQYDVYLSFVKCKCGGAKVPYLATYWARALCFHHIPQPCRCCGLTLGPLQTVCLRCVDQLCECATDARTLCYRMPLSELEDYVHTVHEMVHGHKRGQKRRHDEEDSPTEESADTMTPPHNATESMEEEPSPARKLRALSKHERGSHPKWIAYASAWLKLARHARDKAQLDLEVVADLVAEAGPYVWRGHEMDHIREEVSELAQCVNTARDICNALDTRQPIQAVQKLIVAGPQLKLPLVEEVGQLQDYVQQSMEVAAAIKRELKKPKINVSTVTALISQASALPVIVEEEATLHSLVAQLKAWQEHALYITNAGLRTRKTQERRVPMVEVEKMIDAAEKLPIDAKEVPQLQRHVAEAVKWEEKAMSHLKESTTLEQLQELCEAGARLPIEAGPALEQLNQIVAKVLQWRESVKGMSVKSATLKEMEERVQAATKLGADVQTPELTRLKRGIQQGNWEDEARRVLNGEAGVQACEDLLQMAAEAGYTGMYVKGLKERAEQVEAFLVKVRTVMGRRDRCQMSLAEKLANEARKKELDFKEVRELRRALEEVAAWKKLLGTVRYSRHQSTKKVMSPPLKGKAGKAPSKATSSKKDTAKAAEASPKHAKGSAAEAALKEHPPLSQAIAVLEAGKRLKLHVPEVESLQGQVELARAFQAEAVKGLHMCNLKDIACLVGRSQSIVFNVPELKQVRVASEAVMWARKVERLLKNGAHLEVFVQYLEQAEAMGLQDDHPAAKELPALRDAVHKANKVARQVAAALKRGADDETLRRLKESVDSLLMHIDEEEELEHRLSEQKTLGDDVEAMLEASPLPTLAEMKALRNKVVSHKLCEPAAAIRKLKDGVAKAEEWELDAKAAFFPSFDSSAEDAPRRGKKRKRKSSAKRELHLEECLAVTAVVTDAMLEKQVVARVGARQSKKSYCYCGEGDDGDAMLCCDLCQEWYHAACLDIPETAVEDPANSKFYCPACFHSARLPFAFRSRTARPAFSNVTALALSASALRCVPPLSQAVQELAAAAHAFVAETQALPMSPSRKGNEGKGSPRKSRKNEDAQLELHARGQALELQLVERDAIAEHLAEICATQLMKSLGSSKDAAHHAAMCSQHSSGPATMAVQAVVKEQGNLTARIQTAVQRKFSLTEQRRVLSAVRSAKVEPASVKKLEAAIKSAQSWQDEARALLKNDSRHKLPTVQRLMDRYASLQTSMESEHKDLQQLQTALKQKQRYRPKKRPLSA